MAMILRVYPYVNSQFLISIISVCNNGVTVVTRATEPGRARHGQQRERGHLHQDGSTTARSGARRVICAIVLRGILYCVMWYGVMRMMVVHVISECNISGADIICNCIKRLIQLMGGPDGAVQAGAACPAHPGRRTAAAVNIQGGDQGAPPGPCVATSGGV